MRERVAARTIGTITAPAWWTEWALSDPRGPEPAHPQRELELLVESGFSPLEAITAATGTAAGFLYRGEELGTLRPGLKADVLVVRGDPSHDISAVRAVDRVMVDGRWVDIVRYRAR